MFTYLDFPPVPKHFEQQILDLVNKSLPLKDKDRDELNITANQEVIDTIKNIEISNSNSLGVPLNEVWDHFKDVAYFDFLEVSNELNEWARENINLDIAYVSVQVIYGGTTIAPHIDEMRTKAINYIINTGGNSKTCFYKPKKEFEYLTAYPQTVFPFDKLEMVEEVQIESYQWHKLDVTKIHSVENLDPAQKRISLSLSIL